MKTQISQTYKTYGPRGFYRGFSWFAVANIPADMIYLYGYAMSKQTLLNTNFGQKYPTAAYMLSGAAGDFFSIVIVVPLEVVAQVLSSFFLLDVLRFLTPIPLHFELEHTPSGSKFKMQE